MSVKQAAAVTGGAVVAGWIIGLAGLYALLVYGPDMKDIQYPLM